MRRNLAATSYEQKLRKARAIKRHVERCHKVGVKTPHYSDWLDWLRAEEAKAE